MLEVDRPAFAQYQEALKDRRSGGVSSLGPDDQWVDIKPEFYADARILSEDAFAVFDRLLDTHPPYGLVGYHGEALDSDYFTEFEGTRLGRWHGLSLALRSSGHYSVEYAQPSLKACSYHEVLSEKLGGTRPPLIAYDQDERGLDTLRDVVTPGAMLNANLFTSLIYRLPALQRLHGNSTDVEAFARGSAALLREPLAHPQQWAAAFVLSLGAILEFHTPQFLNDELASEFTEVATGSSGDHLVWAKPTEDLTLRQEVATLSRVRGSERQPDKSNGMLYPNGTRLGDIQVDEPTIGCPGNKLANAMWQRAVSVAVAEGLGDYK